MRKGLAALLLMTAIPARAEPAPADAPPVHELPADALPARAPPVAPALAGSVTYEVLSWGRLLMHWQVNPDGTGEIWRSARDAGKPETIHKFRLALDGEPFAAFVRNAEDARRMTRSEIPCDKEIFDLPYGSMTWNYPDDRQVYKFDAGCTAAESEEAMRILGAASTIVETLARVDAKPYMTEAVPSR